MPGKSPRTPRRAANSTSVLSPPTEALYPDISQIPGPEQDSFVGAGDQSYVASPKNGSSFTEYRNRSKNGSRIARNDESDESDEDFVLTDSSNQHSNSSFSSSGDSLEGADVEIEEAELNQLKRDQRSDGQYERSAPMAVHGRGSIHDFESPSWRSKCEPKTRQRDHVVNRLETPAYRQQQQDQHFLKHSTPRYGPNYNGEFPGVTKRKPHQHRSEYSDSEDATTKIPHHTEEKRSICNLNVVKIVALLVVIFVIFTTFMSFGRNDGVVMRSSAKRPTFNEFRVNFQKVSDEFEQQKPRVWSSLLTATRSLFDKNPQRPGVAVVAYSGSDVTARCVTSLFALEFSKMFGNKTPLTIPSALITDSKETLDTTLEKYFGNWGKVAIFPNLEKFDSGSLLLMHDYCDDQYASFKHALLIFLVQVPDDVSTGSVEDFLTKKFESQVREDEAGALVSRVVRNIAKIDAEEEGVLEKLGCT